MVPLDAASQARNTWNDMLVYLRQFHSPVVRQWFSELEPIEISSGTLTVRCQTLVQQQHLSMKCRPVFVEAVQSVTGRLLGVNFICPGSAGLNPVMNLCNEVPLSPDFIFENFVVGPANDLAHRACQAVAMQPGRVYNPLFIHGAPGLGKTHLLQATCQDLLSRQPDVRILYITCEQFVNHFMESISSGNQGQFRQLFRNNCDVLVVDDIHFLAGRDRSQEEFFHTFNALLPQGKQIILSSDSPPRDIPSMEERLVSRFANGLLAEVEPPCFETRLIIVKRKAHLRGVGLPEDVAEFVAKRCESNVREIEGAITKLMGQAMLNGGVYNLTLAQAALGDLLPQANRMVSILQVVGHVTRFFNVRVPDLQGKKRHKSITLPRQVCMYLVRKYTQYSLEETGGFFGGRDHTTVMHSVKTIEHLRQADAAFARQIEQIETGLEREISRPAVAASQVAS